MTSKACLEKNERLHEEVRSAPPRPVIDVCFIREEHCYLIKKDRVDLLYIMYIWKY